MIFLAAEGVSGFRFLKVLGFRVSEIVGFLRVWGVEV